MSKEVRYALLVFIGVMLFLTLRGPLEEYFNTISNDQIFNHLLAGIIIKVIITVALLYIIIYKKLLAFSGLKPFQTISSARIIIAPLILLAILCSTNYHYFIEAERTNVILHAIHTITIGLFEELTMRGIVLPLLLYYFKTTSKAFFKAIFFSSMLFGVAHYSHLVTNPTEAVGITTQVVFAIGMGFYLAALLLRTGNIIVPIIIHALIDFFGGAGQLIKSKEEATSGASTPSLTSWIALILVACFLIGISINMLKKVNKTEWYRRLSFIKV